MKILPMAIACLLTANTATSFADDADDIFILKAHGAYTATKEQIETLMSLVAANDHNGMNEMKKEGLAAENLVARRVVLVGDFDGLDTRFFFVGIPNHVFWTNAMWLDNQ